MFHDNRGTLIFPVKNDDFNVKETIVSINHKNVFRGIHVESFFKLIHCIQGKILDIVINFNENEDDFLIPKYYILDPTTTEYKIFVKPNHGHAFLSLEPNTIVLYHYNGIYNNENTKTYNYKDPIFNIQLPIENPIVSDKDLAAPFFRKIDFYLFGGNGFIGQVIADSIRHTQCSLYKTKLRLEQTEKIEKELILYKPKYVICSAGLTGNPNILWCDTHKTETIETNITYQMTLAHLCKKHGIHLTVIGSGVIFQNDKYYGEEDEGNFDENFYGKCRIYLENMLRTYENVLYVRINYPISKNYSPKNLITKLLSYPKIEDVNITLTYLDELIPILITMIQNGELGICNLINKDTVNTNDIISIYEKENQCSLGKEKIKGNTKKSSSKLLQGKLSKYNTMNAFDAVTHCIRNYIAENPNPHPSSRIV